MDYFDLNLELSKEDIIMKAAAREFAQKVMRPISLELDKMSAEEVASKGSPFWEFMKKAYELDFHKILIPEYYGGEGLSPLQIHLIYEEFGWASFGLAVELYVTAMPFVLMVMKLAKSQNLLLILIQISLLSTIIEMRIQILMKNILFGLILEMLFEVSIGAIFFFMI